VSRVDIIACWQNAALLWIGINPICLIQEPAELIAARALFVHSQLSHFAEDRASFSYAMWSLVAPYCTRKR
jgi:hypothetical protein